MKVTIKKDKITKKNKEVAFILYGGRGEEKKNS
jgi:hypothetical protein